MRVVIKTTDELVELIEGLAQKARSEIGTTRTKLESNELKGQVYAYNEVIFYVKEFAKTQKEIASHVASDQMEPVASAAFGDLSDTADDRAAEAPQRVKA